LLSRILGIVLGTVEELGRFGRNLVSLEQLIFLVGILWTELFSKWIQTRVICFFQLYGGSGGRETVLLSKTTMKAMFG